MAAPLWFVDMLKVNFGRIFELAKRTGHPVVGPVAERALFEHDDVVVLPNDRVIRVDRAIGSVEHQVIPSQVVEHFVRESSHRWIMERCICRDSCACQDYPVDLGCLFMGEAATGINAKLGHPATVDEALEHVERCRAAGLVHLVGRVKLDTLWLNVRPGHRLLTVCSCCPCCCISRVLPHVHGSISAKVTRMPGVTVTVTDDCVGCGTCVDEGCFVDALELDGDRVSISADCRGCGRCADTCPSSAIEVAIEDGGAVRKSVERIAAVVDVS